MLASLQLLTQKKQPNIVCVFSALRRIITLRLQLSHVRIYVLKEQTNQSTNSPGNLLRKHDDECILCLVKASFSVPGYYVICLYRCTNENTIHLCHYNDFELNTHLRTGEL